MAMVMLGIIAGIEKKGLKWVLIPLILGLVYFIPALMLISHLNQGAVQFSNLYRHLGANPKEVMLNPLVSLKFILRPESFNYVVQTFLP